MNAFGNDTARLDGLIEERAETLSQRIGLPLNDAREHVARDIAQRRFTSGESDFTHVFPLAELIEANAEDGLVDGTLETIVKLLVGQQADIGAGGSFAPFIIRRVA